MTKQIEKPSELHSIKQIFTETQTPKRLLDTICIYNSDTLKRNFLLLSAELPEEFWVNLKQDSDDVYRKVALALLGNKTDIVICFQYSWEKADTFLHALQKDSRFIPTVVNSVDLAIKGAFQCLPEELATKIPNCFHVNLQSANLQRRSFYKVDFRGANLHGVNFRDADLEGADFSHANLEHANLANAYIEGACLQNSDEEQNMSAASNTAFLSI